MEFFKDYSEAGKDPNQQPALGRGTPRAIYTFLLLAGYFYYWSRLTFSIFYSSRNDLLISFGFLPFC